ncbi:hypothetical protein LHYA1_G007751 [Lachnellula hyalina]|uniref:Uncharacterized protein n=1 Tax=Lachnellula hyalina TaxID=1316788 RepID=A0A8H8QUX7_9HELO|nr:uncharacterized protein LHYA1_G007751 [Lachnellula hyalina]TVY23204.1 hypothetical protein LHYA1_G007751 [Lachnellula hyalina]
MCHQLIQVFDCGHNTGSKIIECKNPTSDCNEVFLRQELEDIARLCASCQRKEDYHKAYRREVVEDEGYWS